MLFNLSGSRQLSSCDLLPWIDSLKKSPGMSRIVYTHGTVLIGYSSICSTFSLNASLVDREPILRVSDKSPTPGEARQASRPYLSVAQVVTPQILLPLRNGELALPHRNICHCPHAQKRMERLKISWGVQYELARGVLSDEWTWDDVTAQVLERLRGSNAEAAPKVRTVMAEALNKNDRANSQTTNSDVWEEYDREQDALMEGQSRGLGLRGEWKGVPDWYGGRIEQMMTLTKSDGKYTYRLVRPGIKDSTRFARFLGSRRILKVKLAKDLRYERDNSTREHLSGPFILCGRIFVPFSSKDGNAYLMETNEDLDRQHDSGQGDDTRISLWDFLEWHNPLRYNQNQPLSKWSTRFDLGLSTTIPILQFEPRNIAFEPDIEAPHNEGEAPGSEKILTDGCGFINGAALTLIARRLRLSSRPTAVQGRVAGAKGLWILHPEDRSPTEPPRIWIRKSQQKVVLPGMDEGSAHVIFDLVAQSTRITVPSRLNAQFIMNLAENGVDHKVFEDLMHEGMSEAFTSLTQWDGHGAMPLLWSAVNKVGNVTRTHLQELVQGLARAIGLHSRGEKREDEDDVPRDDDSSSDERNKPLSQMVLELIQAGFNPKTSPYLRDKIQYMVREAMYSYSKKYRIEVRQSAMAFIVPDPFGVLEEGEIHFRSLQELAGPLKETSTYSIRGPVLVSRTPTMVASDIQKVTAVEHEKLADYTNVIVFSTKGSRSLASLLAGGGSSSFFPPHLETEIDHTRMTIHPDYDGDTVMVNWSPSVLEAFKQPNLVDKPDGFEKTYFEDNVELVNTFSQRVREERPADIQKSFLSAVLRGLENDYVGRYSSFHSNAVYTKGYSDPATIRLAYMFTTCLDSKKTGHRIRRAVLENDSKLYGLGGPACLRDVEELDEWNQNCHIKRPDALGRFVLDVLREIGEVLADKFLADYEKLGSRPGMTRSTQDLHLLVPYQKIEAKLSQMASLPRVNVNDFIQEARKELGMIEEHVRNMKSEWPKACRGGTAKKKTASKQKREVTALRRRFASGPDTPHLSLLGDIPEIRASYAYKLCISNNPTFAFSMAHDELCGIKARETGGITLNGEFAALMEIPKPAVRALSAIQSLT
ncbi:RNA dependent RNA polymerase-domain-containing protein [Russula earlei]|uniref:RNA dependent RNA polymerase-domain-containing protein n=1 Tax=Russula earlei TaxID=71964 RepID=A0ACC0UN30_9AGAM|nr:RNA dependent RNA polymerase-domain-containing protein [Russula earlei]